MKFGEFQKLPTQKRVDLIDSLIRKESIEFEMWSQEGMSREDEFSGLWVARDEDELHVVQIRLLNDYFSDEELIDLIVEIFDVDEESIDDIDVSDPKYFLFQVEETRLSSSDLVESFDRKEFISAVGIEFSDSLEQAYIKAVVGYIDYYGGSSYGRPMTRDEVNEVLGL